MPANLSAQAHVILNGQCAHCHRAVVLECEARGHHSASMKGYL